MKAISLFLSCLTLGLTTLVSASEKPNMLFIVIDDAGYDDFGFTGCTDWKTPHIDSIAHQGTTFTDGYVTASVCGPSRAGLITGRYQQSFGHEENITPGQQWKVPAEKFGLPVEVPTLGTLLKQKGYTTAAFGKWHLGEHENFHPNKRGFDHFVGFLGGHRSFWPLDKGHHAYNLRENNTVVKTPKYLTDHLGDKAAEFIRANKKSPFFMYLSYNAVHSPLHATEEDLESLSHIKNKRRRVLGAMTIALDRSIGVVLKELKDQGLSDNTIVVFTNDNGAATYLKTNNGGLRGRKGSLWEGGLRVPYAVKWPSKIKAKSTLDVPVNLLDVGYSFCKHAGYSTEELQNLQLPGTDLVDIDQDSKLRRNLYWKRGNTSAIRAHKWKLITLKGEATFLFDLSSDIKETNNLIDKYPQITKKLHSDLTNWEAQLPAPLWKKKSANSYHKHLLKSWDNKLTQ